MAEIQITPDLLAELKRKAEATPPGAVWHQENGVNGVYLVRNDGGWRIATTKCEEDALFIAAADPATVLALVAEIERLRAMERRWHKLLANAQPGPECIGQGFEVKAIKAESDAAGE